MQDTKDLLKESYNYYLPKELIAMRPTPNREEARLLVYNNQTQEIIHSHFYELHKYLPSESLLVLNESKVFPCRFHGNKESGGKCELFLLTLVQNEFGYEALIKSRGKKEIGDKFIFNEVVATINHITDRGSFYVKFNIDHTELLNVVDSLGEIPIPPYIRDGISDAQDAHDYQTIFAKNLGSVAAPTAGLHFTDSVFKSLEEKGIKKDFVTLHVGAGTFKPVDTESILDHKMHEELYSISKDTLDNLNSNYPNIFAVGTTSLRTLESSFNSESKKFEVKDDLNPTSIFLYPGVPVHSIAGLVTNFHLPESTLIMLVSSLIGREKTLELYNIAVKEKYRFFSYGDAMLILR